MGGWGEILKEIGTQRDQYQQAASQGNPLPGSPFDTVRRKYLQELSAHTGRPVILYATQWTQPGAPAELISITDEDMVGLMEVVRGNSGPTLDLILHTPGGSPTATEAIVDYLRSKYDNIRVIVPHAAMSAGTMLACAADRIVMGKHSSLGPIDPQMLMPGPNGNVARPAQAILDQFELGKQECANPANLGPWFPILQQFGPSLIVECNNAIALSKRLVGSWLGAYMFGATPGSGPKARGIAKKLANHKLFLSHGRHISRDVARSLGLVVDDLESSQQFQDLVLSIFHATMHTFSATSAVKIIENQLGRAFVKMNHPTQQVIQVPVQSVPQGPKTP